MATVAGAFPVRPNRVRAAGAAAVAVGRTAADRARTAGRRLSGSVLTVAGLTCFDIGAFQWHTLAGWITTGGTLLVLEWNLDDRSRSSRG